MDFSWTIHWSLQSELDPRWNASGKYEGTLTDGKPKAAMDHLENCMKDYGAYPKDLVYCTMKE